MHDSRGASLKVGDRVLIEAEVTNLCEGDDTGYCNVTIQVVTPQQAKPPEMTPPTLSAINTRMLTKVGAALLLLVAFATGAFASEPPVYSVTPGYSVKAAKPSCSCAFGCSCYEGKPCECSPGCPCEDAASGNKCPGRKADPRFASVYVSVDLGNGTSAGGTGTVIANENDNLLVLTNAHVVEDDSRPIYVTHWDKSLKAWKQQAIYLHGAKVTHHGSPGSASIPSTSRGWRPRRVFHANGSFVDEMIHVEGPDLALLYIKGALPAVELASEIPSANTPVFIYGFGGATDKNNLTPLHKTGKYLGDAWWANVGQGIECQTDIATVNGDSGSGIFNSSGELVAVHWGGGAVRLDTVHTFTVSTLKSKRVLFPKLHDKLSARKIARAAKSAAPKAAPTPPKAATQPPKVQAPAPAPFTIVPGANSCPGGKCHAQAPSRRGLFGRR